MQRNDSECFKISSSGSYVLYNNVTGVPHTVYLLDINKQMAVWVEINSQMLCLIARGILWDTSDGGSECSGTRSTVWAVKASPSPEPDTYGEYMYAAMIPYTLATYEGAGNTITIYIELE
ncbi:MAG: hypothetical protein QW255_03480 [Candidatus Bilamarchaeaceae archaeon]